MWFSLFLVWAVLQFSSAEVESNEIYNHYRLPTSVRPEHYRLDITTHLNDDKGFEFYGAVDITIKSFDNVNNITLHSKNLTIDQTQILIENLDESNKEGIKLDSVLVNTQHDYYIMKLASPLKKDSRYLLRIPFKAELSQSLYGYYRSVYTDKKSGEKRYLSTTQFEPTSARLAFPCFDEPSMKAKFSIALTHHKKFRAISNMPIDHSKPLETNNEWVTDQFKETVPMSTYLVAYSVNDFEFDEVKVKLESDVTFRTWARSDAMSQVEYAGFVGPKVLQFYENLFDIKFPLPKIDQIAVPDFSAGAMENWGLVTYRETALLYAKNISSLSSKHRVASVISHELAHQWFGNLVTMEWWTDLWLNEGFATYIASLGVEHIHPEWDSYKEESVDNVLDIFKIDSLKSSHPISQEITDAARIPEIFDSISYSKGSCVLRMMHLFLGDQAFFGGVSKYLKQYAYANAEQDNLWDSLTVSARELKTIPENYNIKTIMDSWTLQTGYPVVEIIRNYEDNSATIKQNRYLTNTNIARSSLNECWWIPMSYTTESDNDFNSTRPKNWMECADQQKSALKIENLGKPDEWVLFNIQLAGLYKVKYDQKNWDMLIETLKGPKFESISSMNRAQLIDDAMDLAWTGDQDYDIAMHLMEYLRQETEYLPWKSAIDNIRRINIIIMKTAQYDLFKRYVRKIIEPIYEHLGGLNQTEDDPNKANTLYYIKHKVLVTGTSCKFEVGDCVATAIKYFKEWQQKENPDEDNPVPKDLRSVVYCNAIRHGYEDEWNFLWKRYENSGVASEKQTILSTLACTREVWILQRYLEWTFLHEESKIRKQDAFTVFVSVASNIIGYPLAKEFLMDNIDKIAKLFTVDTSKMGRLISPIASQINTEKEYNILKNFIDERSDVFAKSQESIKRALESVEINIQWMQKNYKNINDILRNFS